MRIYYILAAAVCWLVSAAALADTTAAGDSKAPEPPPWYQVEVVIFAHADATDTEVWRDDPGVPDMDHAVTLSPAASSPDLKDQLKTLSGGDEKGQGLAAFLTAEAGQDGSAPVAYRMLPPAEQQLQPVVTRLNHADGYRVLFHAAWRQPAYGPDKAVPVRIHDDPYGTQSAMLRSLDQAGAQGAGADTDTGDMGAADSDSGDDHAAAPPSIWLLNGVVEVTQSRYVHLSADLVYQVQSPDGSAAQSSADGTAGTDNEVVHTYRLQQSRRILNDKLYYFDHPEFGLLAKVAPYQPPQPKPKPGDQSGQPAAP